MMKVKSLVVVGDGGVVALRSSLFLCQVFLPGLGSKRAKRLGEILERHANRPRVDFIDRPLGEISSKTW